MHNQKLSILDWKTYTEVILHCMVFSTGIRGMSSFDMKALTTAIATMIESLNIVFLKNSKIFNIFVCHIMETKLWDL